MRFHPGHQWLTNGFFLLAGLFFAGAAIAQCLDYGNILVDPELTSFNLFPDGEINDFVLADDIAWVARSNYGALVSVDFSDPDQPTTLGLEPVDVMNETYDVDFAGSLAFVSYLQWGGVAGVRVFDISDPANPLDIGDIQAPTGRWASYLAAAGDLIYVSFAYDTFGIVDVSTPTDPVLVSQLTIDHPWRITIAGNFAFVASSESDPVIVDISVPTAPEVFGNLTTSGGGRDVAIVGNLAYVATGAALDIIDVTDLTSTSVLGTLALPGTVYEVSVSGTIAYVSCSGNGVQVIDVTDPVAPSIRGVINVPGFIYSSTELDDRLIANSNGMLHVAPAQCPLDVTGAFPTPASAGLALTCRPNPFNPRTVVSFDLARDGWAMVRVHALNGYLVTVLADHVFPAGSHRLPWDGRDSHGQAMPSGTYLVHLQTETGKQSYKIALIR